MNKYMHTHLHTYTHSYTHIHTYKYIYVHVHTMSYIHTHTSIHTCTHNIDTYIYTCIHTHTYIHSFIPFIPDIYIAPLQETYSEALSVQLQSKRNVLRSLQKEDICSEVASGV